MLEKAIEKLWVHGGAIVDPDETVRRGPAKWRAPYEAQRKHKREQLDKMRRYAETPRCRMLQMVAHFGDQNDSAKECGTCDVCDPSASIAHSFRAPSASEEAAAHAIVDALHERDGRSVGQLLREVFDDGSLDRRALDHVLGALARARTVRLEEDEFEKDGKTIVFQRVWLTRGAGAMPLRAPVVSAQTAGRVVRRSPGERPPKAAKATKLPKAKRTRASASYGESTPGTLDTALRAWRLAEAKKRRLPAFRILTERTLVEIAAQRPTTETDLLAVSGMGPALCTKYGANILALVRANDS